MKNEIEDLIVKARVKMLLKFPFFGALALRLKIVNNDELDTMATDGRHMFYNSEFVKSLTSDELVFVVAHEVMHNVYDHFSRVGSRDPQKWNIAGDYVINNELVELNVGTLPTRNITPCYDKKFAGLTTEEVYDIIKDDPEYDNSFDQHCKLAGMTEEETKQLRDEIAQAVMEAAKSAGGKIPESVKRMVDGLLAPKMDWRQVLQAEIQSCFKSDYTFERPNRKTASMGIMLPSTRNDVMIDVAVAIDTSGSITSDEVKAFLSEVKGIMNQFNDFSVTVWCFDTSTHNVAKFDPYTIEQIHNYEPHGGGGTEFECNFEMMKENEIVPNKLIIMTDGYPNKSWGDETYCETIFLITTPNVEAPYGTSIHYTK